MIHYHFRLQDGQVFHFSVDPKRTGSLNPAENAPAFWTRLEYHQCTRCPLRGSAHQHCPAALDTQHVAETFSSIISHARVSVEVNTPERTYLKETDAQTALRSLFGLVMATSGCPILSRFRGLAQMHLPFATLKEMTFRSVGSFLLHQYFRHQDGEQADWDLESLEAFCADLARVNECFKARLDDASVKDANLNAISSLFAMAIGVSMALQDQLKNFRHLTIDTEKLWE